MEETRTVVNATSGSGSGIDEDETVTFFEDTVARVCDRVGDATELFLRADEGFWSRKVCGWMVEKGLPFACALPLAPAVKVLLLKARFQPVEGEDDIQVSTHPEEHLGYDAPVRVVVIRRRVHHPKATPPGKALRGDFAWRYQAIVTSLTWDAVEVWRFNNDGGGAERVFKVGRALQQLQDGLEQPSRPLPRRDGDRQRPDLVERFGMALRPHDHYSP